MYADDASAAGRSWCPCRVTFPPVPPGWEPRPGHPDGRWTLTYGPPEGRGAKPGPRPTVPDATVTTGPDPLTVPRPGAWANY